MTRVYVWPDDMWCWEDEFESVSQGRSDDFQIFDVDDFTTEELINELVYLHNHS